MPLSPLPASVSLYFLLSSSCGEKKGVSLEEELLEFTRFKKPFISLESTHFYIHEHTLHIHKKNAILVFFHRWLFLTKQLTSPGDLVNAAGKLPECEWYQLLSVYTFLAPSEKTCNYFLFRRQSSGVQFSRLNLPARTALTNTAAHWCKWGLEPYSRDFDNRMDAFPAGELKHHGGSLESYTGKLTQWNALRETISELVVSEEKMRYLKQVD